MATFDTIHALLEAVDCGVVGRGDAVVIPDEIFVAQSRYERTTLLDALRGARVELRMTPARTRSIAVHMGGAAPPVERPGRRRGRRAATGSAGHPWAG